MDRNANDGGLFTEDIRSDPEIRRRVRTWIDALRSGLYARATGFLRTDEGFCCLGVACDLIDPERWKRKGQEWVYRDTNYDKVSVLQEHVQLAYGLTDEEGNYRSKTCLAHDNDSGRSFNEIANTIEHELRRSLTTD